MAVAPAAYSSSGSRPAGPADHDQLMSGLPTCANASRSSKHQRQMAAAGRTPITCTVVGGLTRHLLGGGKRRPHVDVEPVSANAVAITFCPQVVAVYLHLGASRILGRDRRPRRTSPLARCGCDVGGAFQLRRSRPEMVRISAHGADPYTLLQRSGDLALHWPGPGGVDGQGQRCPAPVCSGVALGGGAVPARPARPVPPARVGRSRCSLASCSARTGCFRP